jgi:hypothetical protein
VTRQTIDVGIRRTVELCRKALAEARSRPDDVDRVLLVCSFGWPDSTVDK